MRSTIAILTASLLAAFLAMGCGPGLDRVETASTTTVAASQGPTTNAARALLARECERAESDPRIADDRARECAAEDGGGCLRLGVAHMCGATGEENGALAMPLLEKACQLREEHACQLLLAARLVWRRPGEIVSLLDDRP